MNQVIIDNSLLVAALVTSVVISQFLKRRKTSALFASLLLFLPLITFLNMWAHTTAIIIVNIRRYYAGHFHYTFTVYGQFLFGTAFIFLSGLTIHLSKKYITGDKTQKRNILLANLATAAFFLPVIPLNPIGALPIITAVFSSILLLAWKPFGKKDLGKKVTSNTVEPSISSSYQSV